jgi:chemotaxis protein histidine kinase CheA
MEREMSDRTREEKMAAAQARMAELAKKFLDRSAGDLVVMRADLAKLAQGQREAVTDLRQLAHRMVGTGATLGFETIAARAHDLESIAEGCAPDSVPDEDIRGRFSTAMDALEAELRRARGA